ncbi:MAG: hypothetical protein PHI18_04855, partial [bacterium]|nr:hypothetical protein [bacterium]
LMDDAAREQKIRSLKIRILQAEREIAAKQHGSKLNAFLSVGHASQIAKTSEREVKRIEDKLDGLRKQLLELDPTAAPTDAEEKVPSAAAATRESPTKKTAATTSAAAAKPAKKPAKKSKG